MIYIAEWQQMLFLACPLMKGESHLYIYFPFKGTPYPNNKNGTANIPQPWNYKNLENKIWTLFDVFNFVKRLLDCSFSCPLSQDWRTWSGPGSLSTTSGSWELIYPRTEEPDLVQALYQRPQVAGDSGESPMSVSLPCLLYKRLDIFYDWFYMVIFL